MFSSYYEPLPDLDKALERIGCPDLKIDNTIETLDKLIYGFQTHVPYENLTVSREHRIPSLASGDLYEKFVEKRRGGYCFEMNGFFWLLLRDLGFKVYSVSAYVLEYRPFMGDLGHRANVATVDGKKHFVDVGFGGKNTATCAIPMDGSVKDRFFVKYDEEEREYTLCRIVDEEEEIKNGREDFVMHGMVQGEEVPYIRITLFRDFKAYPQEFHLPNIGVFYVGNNHMIDNVIVNFKNDRGEVYTIFNDEFRGKTSEGTFSRKIKDDDDMNEILKKYFGMII